MYCHSSLLLFRRLLWYHVDNKAENKTDNKTFDYYVLIIYKNDVENKVLIKKKYFHKKVQYQTTVAILFLNNKSLK